MRAITITFIICMCIFSCKNESTKSNTSIENQALTFESIPASVSGIKFINKIEEFNEQTNYLSYFHNYHGSGVAAGDFNNDGLTDLFFQSSLNGPQLYKNKGNLIFELILLDPKLFNKGDGNGVTLVDINNDGLLDIYLCYSGYIKMPEAYKTNKLLINKGDFKFVEAASDYGLDNNENSSQAAFFDFDKDGDLDMYLVNTNTEHYFAGNLIKEDVLKFGHPLLNKLKAQDRLFENKGKGKYVDITEKSGLIPELFFSFNASLGDYNADGWPDIFVTNDFYTPDLLYINNKNGTFTESALTYFKHTSYNSMGSDASDINNDGLDDIVAVDMWPEDYIRSRENMGMVNVGFTEEIERRGYGKKYMHNVLQLNTGEKVFQEISQFSGVSKTDWSWSILNDDFNNDGYKDMYVTNGILRDINDYDAYNKRTAYLNSKQRNVTIEKLKSIVEEMPSVPIPNYLFINQGDLTYKNATTEVGLDIPSFSQGCVTVDLDNDGDLDIVTNNTNQEAFLFENKSVHTNYIQVKLKGSKQNNFGLGAKICITTENNYQCQNMYVSRGYYSSTDYRLHFGLGNEDITSLKITWPDGKVQELLKPNKNNILTLEYANAILEVAQQKTKQLLFTQNNTHAFSKHKENKYNDYQHQLLLPHKLSELGPALAKADLNGDGLEDVFIGGATNEPGLIYLQKDNGSFVLKTQPDFIKDKLSEDTSAIFFDFDNDNDKDLFVVSGSYEFNENSTELSDRLYINNGNANFSKYDYGTVIKSNAMTVTAADIDNDNDLDLFIGGRVIKGKYPFSPRSYLLINDNGKLVDKTETLAKELSTIGMVTDAEFTDIDNDNDDDLVIVGEWMPVTFFENNNGKFSKKTTPTDSISSGWWNTIKLGDINNDGLEDLILGNLGLNYKFSASPKKPLEIYCDDFDKNGTYDIVLAKPLSDFLVPIRGKMCSSQQIPGLKEKFPSFESFANASLIDIYGEELNTSLHLNAVKFENCVFINKGDFNFKIKDLPNKAQLSPIKSVITKDFNGDGNLDLLIAGNLYQSEVETTRADAGIGLLLLGNGDGTFSIKDNLESGFFADGDVRHLQLINGNKNQVIAVSNNDNVRLYEVNKPN